LQAIKPNHLLAARIMYRAISNRLLPGKARSSVEGRAMMCFSSTD
jgi:hypothetical protein